MSKILIIHSPVGRFQSRPLSKAEIADIAKKMEARGEILVPTDTGEILIPPLVAACSVGEFKDVSEGVA